LIFRPAGSASVVSAGLLLTTFFALLILVPSRAAGQNGCSTSSFTSSDVPKAIPDPGTAESALVVPVGKAIAAVAVRVTITHPFDSDLKIELVSPRGGIVNLAEAVGMWGSDFTDTVFDDGASSSIVSQLPPFTGTFRPVEPLAAFTGSGSAGAWKLRVADLRARYAGELVSWGLDVTGCATPPTPVQKPAGAPDPPPLPTGVPAGHIPAEGTVITVNTIADDDDAGPVTVAQLLAHPGADGTISLREAIEATNNDPGKYTIHFAPALEGKSIDIANPQPGPLPPLQGSGVLIDGDIDGDGRPDVTITNHLTDPLAYGFQVFSGDNRLHALALQGFPSGIQFLVNFAGPLPANQTYAHDIVSGVEISTNDLSGTGVSGGISLFPNLERGECAQQPVCETRNTWTDMRLVGNRIESRKRAIFVHMAPSVGDALERLTIAGNAIQIGAPDSTDPNSGIDLSAGYEAGAGGNRVSGALIAYNTIDVEGKAYAISATAGGQGGASNTVEDLAIVANRVQFTGIVTSADSARGVNFAVSDGCAPDSVAGSDCSQNDILRRVQVVGNVFSGQDDAGVLVADPCCGGTPSSNIIDLLVSKNLIQGIVPPAELNPRGIVIAGHTNVANVTIDANTIEQETIEPLTEHVADLAGAGILVVGGLGSGTGPVPGAHLTTIHNVLITNNRIDTDLTGIALVGGGPSDEDGATDTYGHVISGVALIGNVIVHSPILATPFDPGIKGITLIGGLAGRPPATTTFCSVTDVGLFGNLVVGVLNDVSVISNFGDGASGNVAKLGQAPRVIAPVTNPPPIPVTGRQ
jgi:subtilisin-like proprotein convertase family protein